MDEEEKEAKAKAGLIATEPRGDDDKGQQYSKMKENVPNRTQVRDSKRVVNEGEGEVARFDGQWAKVKEEELEWCLESGRSKTKGKRRNVRKECFIDPTCCKNLPDRGTVLDET